MSTRKNTANIWTKVIGRPMSPTEHLLDTQIFRLAIVGPIISASIIAAVGLYNSGVTAEWSLSGFNNFVDLFKLPLGVAGLSIPLGALVASHHRSVQSASQIDAQDSQNTFSNFLQHKEYFGRYIDQEQILQGDFSFRAKDKKIYQALFPLAQKGNREFILAEDKRNQIAHALGNLATKVELLNWNNLSKFELAWQALEVAKSAISDEFLLQISDYVHKKNVETLLNQVHNIQITLDHIHSAASLFEQSKDAFQLYSWMNQAGEIRNNLQDIHNFQCAKKRICELSPTVKNNPGHVLSSDQVHSVHILLGNEEAEKLAYLREDLADFQNIDMVIDQLSNKPI